MPDSVPDSAPASTDERRPDSAAAGPQDAHPLRHLAWPVLGVLTVVTYNTWVFWHPLNGHSRIFDGYLSELSASDQPGNLFFRGGDLITALIVGALAVRAFLVWRHHDRRRWWMVAAGGLALFSLATFFDAFFAMDCSPTLDQGCRVLEETGQLSSIHYAHTYTSVAAQVGIVTSMVAGYIAVRRSYPAAVRRGHLLLGACIAEVVSLGVMLGMIAASLPSYGYPQAVLVLVASLWFAAVGFGVLGPPRNDRATRAVAMSVDHPS